MGRATGHIGRVGSGGFDATLGRRRGPGPVLVAMQAQANQRARVAALRSEFALVCDLGDGGTKLARRGDDGTVECVALASNDGAFAIELSVRHPAAGRQDDCQAADLRDGATAFAAALRHAVADGETLVPTAGNGSVIVSRATGGVLVAVRNTGRMAAVLLPARVAAALADHLDPRG